MLLLKTLSKVKSSHKVDSATPIKLPITSLSRINIGVCFSKEIMDPFETISHFG